MGSDVIMRTAEIALIQSTWLYFCLWLNRAECQQAHSWTLLRFSYWNFPGLYLQACFVKNYVVCKESQIYWCVIGLGNLGCGHQSKLYLGFPTKHDIGDIWWKWVNYGKTVPGTKLNLDHYITYHCAISVPTPEISQKCQCGLAEWRKRADCTSRAGGIRKD